MRLVVFCVAVAVLCWASLASAQSQGDVLLFEALDRVGPLDGHQYDPRPVIYAVNLLQPMGKKAGVAALRRYLALKEKTLQAGSPSGLFVVLRTVFEPPPARGNPPKDACTPRQRAFAAGGCLRAPMLGGPMPPAPEDLRSLRYPAFVLGDVPLSLVSGYILAGQPEPLSMHLDALVKHARWRAKPLSPVSVGTVRYLFTHYGQWAVDSEVGKMVEAQLSRLQPASGPSVPLGLWSLPQSAPDAEAVIAALSTTAPPPPVYLLEHDGKRLLVAILELPTDSESYIHVAAWSYTRHFDAWRLVVFQEVYGAVELVPEIDAATERLVLKDHWNKEALSVPLKRIPYSTKD